MPQITLKDLLEAAPEEILKKMHSQAPSEAVLVKVKESPKVAVEPDKEEINRALYKGAFSTTREFTKGQVFPFQDHTIEVINVEKSSGRVRFIKVGTEEVFSLAFSTLTGTENEMPYKKGDWVIFEGQRFIVKGLNPASKNVVIDYHGKTRYVKLSKLSKITSKETHLNEPNSSQRLDQEPDSNVSEAGTGTSGSEV